MFIFLLFFAPTGDNEYGKSLTSQWVQAKTVYNLMLFCKCLYIMTHDVKCIIFIHQAIDQGDFPCCTNFEIESCAVHLTTNQPIRNKPELNPYQWNQPEINPHHSNQPEFSPHHWIPPEFNPHHWKQPGTLRWNQPEFNPLSWNQPEFIFLLFEPTRIYSSSMKSTRI